jgi:hypothetical protein
MLHYINCIALCCITLTALRYAALHYCIMLCCITLTLQLLWSLRSTGFGSCRGQLKCDGTCTETRIRPSMKRTSPFKSAGASVQSTTGSRGVRISGSNAGCTMFRGSVKGTCYTHSIRQFPLKFSSRASPCAITFQLESTISASHTTLHRPVM